MRHYKVGLLLAFLMAGVTPAALSAQMRGIEITPFYGWQWGGGVSVLNGNLKLEASPVFGGMLAFRVRRDAMVEFTYSRQNTTLEQNLVGGTSDVFDMSVEYFHLGGVYEARQASDRTVPFVSLSAGATRYAPKSPSTLSDEWRFSTILGGGVKAYVSERVGVRGQIDWLLTFVNTGSSVWCGFGGCSFGLGGSGISQGAVAGAVILRL